ncbi:MAG: FlgD immunoglobulin-like domain containing protein [Candidatus Poribacteria bacterium]
MYSTSVFKFTKKAYLIFAFALLVSILLYGTGTENGYALVVKMSLENLSREASSIVVGKVLDAQSQWEDGNIYTYVTVSIELYVKGAGDREVTIKVLGGTVGDITEWVSDAPIFQVGEQTLLFLKDDAVVGRSQGKFAIVGRDVMVEDVLVDEVEFINRIRGILGLPPMQIEKKPQPEIVPAPVITGITPSTTAAGTRGKSPFGPGGGISDIVITGSGFGASTGEVLIPRGYGLPAKSDYIYSWSDTQIECHIPYNAYSGDISVKTSSGATSAPYNYVITYGAYWKEGLDHEVKWPKPAMGENYLVNENCGDVTNELIALQAAMATWSGAGADFTFSYGGSTTKDTSGFDGDNVLAWNDLDAGTIAVNSIWWTSATDGDAIESDIIFNTDYTWSTTGEAGKMDVQNIATHELGHALFLTDLYGAADVDKTMYGYSSTGETKKRTLASEDISGIRYLYGSTVTWTLIYEQMFDRVNPQIALPVLRRYRDEILMADPQGEILVNRLYNEHSVELAFILLTQPQLARRGAAIIVDNLPEIARTLDGEPMEMSQVQLTEVETLLNDVAAVGSPKLKSYIWSVKRMLQKKSLAKLGVNLKFNAEEEIPEATQLLQNTPNPFNPDTWIPYRLASDAPVTISIYNQNGQLIRTLNLGNQKAGNYLTKGRAAYWDGKNSSGDKVASGVYFYTLKAGDFKTTRKMAIVK